MLILSFLRLCLWIDVDISHDSFLLLCLVYDCFFFFFFMIVSYYLRFLLLRMFDSVCCIFFPFYFANVRDMTSSLVSNWYLVNSLYRSLPGRMPLLKEKMCYGVTSGDENIFLPKACYIAIQGFSFVPKDIVKIVGHLFQLHGVNI